MIFCVSQGKTSCILKVLFVLISLLQLSIYILYIAYNSVCNQRKMSCTILTFCFFTIPLSMLTKYELYIFTETVRGLTNLNHADDMYVVVIDTHFVTIHKSNSSFET